MTQSLEGSVVALIVLGATALTGKAHSAVLTLAESTFAITSIMESFKWLDLHLAKGGQKCTQNV